MDATKSVPLHGRLNWTLIHRRNMEFNFYNIFWICLAIFSGYRIKALLVQAQMKNLKNECHSLFEQRNRAYKMVSLVDKEWEKP